MSALASSLASAEPVWRCGSSCNGDGRTGIQGVNGGFLHCRKRMEHCVRLWRQRSSLPGDKLGDEGFRPDRAGLHGCGPSSKGVCKSLNINLETENGGAVSPSSKWGVRASYVAHGCSVAGTAGCGENGSACPVPSVTGITYSASRDRTRSARKIRNENGARFIWRGKWQVRFQEFDYASVVLGRRQAGNVTGLFDKRNRASSSGFGLLKTGRLRRSGVKW